MISTPVLTVYFLYGTIFWVFYFIIFFQLVRSSNKKEFSSSFFKLTKFIAFLDLTGHIAFFTTFKLPLAPMMASYFGNIVPSYNWSFPCFYAHYSEFVRSVFVCATGLNRFSALAYPMKHEDYWNKYFPLVIAVAFLVPFVVLWPLLLSKTSTTLLNLEHDDVFIFIQEELMGYPKWYISLAFALFYATIGITSLTINMVCMWKLREVKRRQSVVLMENGKRYFQQRTEVGLIVVSFGDTVATTLMVVIHLVLYVFEVQDLYYDPLYETMFLQIPWVVDCFRFSRPILLLFMSKSVKEAFIQTFKTVTKVSKITVFSTSAQMQVLKHKIK